MIPSEVRLEHSPCPLCGTSDDVFLFKATDRLNGLPGEFTIVSCRSCGLIRTDPRPTPDSIAYYYPDEYGPYQITRISDPIELSRPRRGFSKWIRRTVGGIFEFNSEITPPLEPGRMLEIGCASGSYLARMAAQGWAVEGIEFSETAAAMARQGGFRVQTSAIEDADPPVSPVKLVVGWMVVEHMHDPQAGLRKLAAWTEDDGWLAISVPNAASLDFHIFRGSGYALQLPTHLYHFTPRTITALLETSGWEVRRIYHQKHVGNYIGSIGYALENLLGKGAISEFFAKLPSRSRKLNHLLYPVGWLLALFGQSGRMTVWAQKRPANAAAK